MQKINLDQLINNVAPVAELTYKGKIIKIVPPNDLPERFYLQFKEASAKLAEMLEKIAPDVAKEQVSTMFGEQTQSVYDGDGELLSTTETVARTKTIDTTELDREWPKLSEIVRSQCDQQVAFREYCEAMMQLERGKLSDEPASAIGQMYQLFSQAVSEATKEVEDEDAPVPQEANEVKAEVAPVTSRRSKRSVNT